MKKFWTWTKNNIEFTGLMTMQELLGYKIEYIYSRGFVGFDFNQPNFIALCKEVDNIIYTLEKMGE